MLDPNEKSDVMSIIGMPGLGKTTLAWKIFKNIRREFPTAIWINVSQTPNIKDLFLNILKEFTSDDMSSLPDHTLIETVQSCVAERKFLLVLDDVWTTKAWDDINKVLCKRNSMSKVLITSREKGVGDRASKPREPHMLRFLTNKESWELLQYEVFGKLDECDADLEKIGRCIAHQCDGLPLAVVVIGGILMDHCTKNEKTIEIEKAWRKVSENVSEFFKSDDKVQGVSDIVALSYNRLPDELRDCLLYLAVFPEDYEISAWTLTRLWIAEGFIKSCQGRTLEETADENLKDLISRNLVMVGKRNSKGGVKTCRVHDLIHAFCSSKASPKQQNLFQEMRFSEEQFYPPVSEIHQCRRLCIHSDLDKFLAQAKKQKTDHVRSLLCFNKASVSLPLKCVPSMVDGFDLLRVLESKSIKLDQIPTRVTKLFHLRYITLCVDNLKALAVAFSNLWNLQTLVVNTELKSLIIKANIWNMIHLRHVKTNAVITQIMQGDGEGCKDLQTLSRISPECCTKGFFERAPNLKRLGVHGKLADLFKDNSLGQLNELEKLKLVNTFHDSESKRAMRFPELRSWFPPNLEMLTIAATNLDWKHMSTLAKIETLLVLKLKDNAFIGKSWETIGGGFRKLDFLLIDETDLFFWQASNDSFPRLTCLVLRNCKELDEIPKGVVERLEKLEIDHLGRSAVESARKIEEGKKLINQGQHRAARSGARFKLTVGAICE